MLEDHRISGASASSEIVQRVEQHSASGTVSPDFVTVVTSATGHRHTKRVERNADGTYNVLDYDQGSTWHTLEQVPLGDNVIGDLWRVLDELTPHQHIVHGRI